MPRRSLFVFSIWISTTPQTTNGIIELTFTRQKYNHPLDFTDSGLLQNALILIVVGIVTGFINTVAGGGSLLTLPVLFFMGFPSAVANGTNRVAIIFSSISSMYAFRRQGIRGIRYGIQLGIPAMAGAVLGVLIAIRMNDEVFKTTLAIIMFAVSVLIIIEPFLRKQALEEVHSPARLGIALVLSFFIGIYGGFVQAGLGFLIIAALSGINHMNLVKTN
ncbi:MAG TPA: sulfite exporter TauE/SafE family protein, partial [Chitinophagales bacterium]|nr:sulfite exporter TauE/SafE family protein [Chitinophagales bacterium]